MGQENLNLQKVVVLGWTEKGPIIMACRFAEP